MKIPTFINMTKILKKNSNNIYKKIYDAIKTFTKKREVLEIGPGEIFIFILKEKC